MTDLIIMILSTIGALFILMAAIGMLRMPDFYCRLSVTTKATTLGIGLALVATAVYFDLSSITSKVVAIIFFLFLTAPVAAHMIGRAAYFIGIKLWEGSVIDELKGRYNQETHELSSSEEPPPSTDASSNLRRGRLHS